MEYELFLFSFLRTFLISSGLILLFVFLTEKFSLFLGKKQAHHTHTGRISRLGGVAIIISFVLGIIFDSNLVITLPMKGVIISSIVILIFGVLDDFLGLSWKKQLFFQICASILIFIFDVHIEYITNPFGGIIEIGSGDFSIASLLLGIIWMVVIMNSMNWFDGVDGVSGGITLLGSIAIIFVSLKPEVNQPPMAIMASVLAGSIMGFLIFNFSPSKIIAGTSGSIFMGFILAVMAIFSGAKIATTLLVMSLPLADFGWVIWKRIRLGKSIFSSDRRHLHHRFLELGWSQKKIALFFYVVTGIVVIISFNIRSFGKIVVIFSVFLLTLIMMLFFDAGILKNRNEIIKK
ncbi:MAG: Glycosyl transferase, family 4 [Candidatus Moranbacteria bacterium GW2011_GWE2_35_2-]|nr:MAG: Glycosyl transferase, family 4 [Candidatus Moranbacteria bacterium GW2011_GWE2_35_2-]KKQ22747.1 MAG: Glycosyl transferase, family 4 [Candidatus Moranbacteria bacterium GW2011_GWF2_37_11]KKQ28901.1 MAG: Glycosyl transferase, family 4 [Candidatus Moranbacteria bacterium GW2011_GWD1_37_17]KKQ31022.1 MAG: Glycosyl transferase, family 4 [Candidatus Moranbacteria bacterium GW2011_GWE1_37_24]KKQ48085.1 MAG: Glycosyl transferase, family 4 [Candidatus Moranbacteria bacterium GW2011_GWD2_37_9]HB